MAQQITELVELKNRVDAWRKAGRCVALVPTMGALHAGHLALVKEARKQAEHVVVSIFVNPTQFGPSEDFSRYPRTLEQDMQSLQGLADVAWVPSVEIMYPQGQHSDTHIEGIGDDLEGAMRPGHFDGVATVVKYLFEQVRPDIALFGEKDYQQFCLIKRLVNDCGIDVSVIGIPTVREADGLAMSSRNRYLSKEERAIAPQLYQTMKVGIDLIKGGEPVQQVIGHTIEQLEKEGFTKIDYLELRAEDTLAPMTVYRAPARLLAAVWLGKTRLIDNVRVA